MLHRSVAVSAAVDTVWGWQHVLFSATYHQPSFVRPDKSAETWEAPHLHLCSAPLLPYNCAVFNRIQPVAVSAILCILPLVKRESRIQHFAFSRHVRPQKEAKEFLEKEWNAQFWSRTTSLTEEEYFEDDENWERAMKHGYDVVNTARGFPPKYKTEEEEEEEDDDDDEDEQDEDQDNEEAKVPSETDTEGIAAKPKKTASKADVDATKVNTHRGCWPIPLANFVHSVCQGYKRGAFTPVFATLLSHIVMCLLFGLTNRLSCRAKGDCHSAY